MRRQFIYLSALGFLAAGAAQGRECSGVSFPEQAQTGGNTLALNGMGIRQATVFKVNVYVAALYLPKPSSDAKAILDANAPYELTMQFVRNVGAKDLAKGWSEGFERNGHERLPVLSERIATLGGWMSDIQTGQQLVFVYNPTTGLQVSVNGTVKGTISGSDFGRAFLSIWLGVPPNPEIKAGMLGGNCT